MLILPAMDLRQGKVVRLLRGDFDAVTQYGDPADTLCAFADAGSAWTHIVDLDGAKAGAPVQHRLIAQLARQSELKLQVGGGVRDRVHIVALMSAGVSRVVVGSAAVREPDLVRRWIDEFGSEAICVALDVRQEALGWRVAIEGWAQSSGMSLEEALAAYPAGTLRHVLVTDISRDGALSGSNVDLIGSLARMRPEIGFQASGGVATLDDIRAQRAAGAAAIVIGRALYERCFTLEDALAV
ncbi:MAG: 1-(5-phosphoribosyl)-5-[(5-phosphoribosylamino)methylideneamino]imidazole-4-carboxamide isomerase [Hyphomonadaceae bacterium]